MYSWVDFGTRIANAFDESVVEMRSAWKSRVTGFRMRNDPPPGEVRVPREATVDLHGSRLTEDVPWNECVENESDANQS